MNPEDRLSHALHASIDAAQPSPDLADRIVERVAVTQRPAARFKGRLGLAGVATIVLVAIALVPLALGLRSSGGPGGSPSPTAPPRQSVVSVAPAGLLAHFDRDGLAFDYPASWHMSISGLNMHYITILEFLGTGSGSATCNAITPGPSDQWISGTQCGPSFDISPGQVVVEISRQDGPPNPGPIDPTDPRWLGPGDAFVTVGGLTAIFNDGSQTSTDQLATLGWTLQVPGELISRFQIEATIKGPDIDLMRAEVEAMVASIQYDPPVPVLDPADGPRIAAIGLEKAVANDPSFACFPKVPGAVATATITQFPMYSPLHKPLPVTCTTAIEPNAIGLWKMTLTESWTAASDRSAGSLTTTIWLAPDGTPGETEGGSGPSEMPYWP